MKTLRCILAAACLWLVGCGALPNTGYDEVRQACWMLTDVELNALVTMAEMDRDAGFTYESEIWTVLDSCGDDFGCAACGISVVDYVYGR